MTGQPPARPDPAFWTGRRVLVTGHTGFKGAWLCLLLDRLGARVSGLALPAQPDGAFAAMRPNVETFIADIRDPVAVTNTLQTVRPEIVVHLAAQALVGEGHARPLDTFATNVMGTANILEALCIVPAAVALVVTTDKVYRAGPGETIFHEDNPLGGADPYSASKVAAEQAVAAWRHRLRGMGCRVATARAGNVLGGGDSAAGRLAPDVIRAHRENATLFLRRPDSVRPWQYVLDVLAGYLLYAQALYQSDAPPALNFGPDPDAAITSAELAEHLQRALGSIRGWQRTEAPFAETVTLRLDSRRALNDLRWSATTDIARAVAWIAAWHQAARDNKDMPRTGQALLHAWMAS